MNQKLKNIVKNNKMIYKIYYYSFSLLMKLLSLFIKVDNQKIFFVSYGGKKYDDSPKVIYEYLKKNKKYKNYKMIWGFIDPNNYVEIDNCEKVKIDTLKYYIEVLSSKYWISNSSVQRGLNFKTQKNKNILFMHGLTALKKSNKDFKSNGMQFKMVKPEQFDLVFIEGKKEEELVLKNVNVKKENIFNYGLPRCDELLSISKNKKMINKIKRELGIDLTKKVILYAPTYREYNKSYINGIITKPTINISKWKKELSEEFVLLITSHYEIGNLFAIEFDNEFVFDVENYNSMNELLSISDILVTDYSNIAFDFTILEKPIFCYGYDYDEYQKKGRGFYNKLENIYVDGVIKSEDEIISIIKNMDIQKEKKASKKIRDEFILNYGNATEKCIEEILK